jgi:hypothetical protein
MEDRQEHEVLRSRREPDRHRAVDGVEHAHPVGDLRALRPPRRAGRVHDRPRVIEVERRRRERACRGGDPSLVVARATVGERRGVRDRGKPADLARGIAEFRAVHQHRRACVLRDELELSDGEPPVERQENGAEAATGELQLEDVGVVVRQHRDAVATSDAEACRKPEYRARHVLVELGIGETTLRRAVMCGRRPGREAGVVSDPILGRNSRRHPFLLGCLTFRIADARARSLVFLTLDGVERPLAGHALELVHTALGEGTARSHQDAVYRVGHEHVARLGDRHDPGAKMHRPTRRRDRRRAAPPHRYEGQPAG